MKKLEKCKKFENILQRIGCYVLKNVQLGTYKIITDFTVVAV